MVNFSMLRKHSKPPREVAGDPIPWERKKKRMVMEKTRKQEQVTIRIFLATTIVIFDVGRFIYTSSIVIHDTNILN